MTCIVTGDRRRSEVDGKGLVVPCVYIHKSGSEMTCIVTGDRRRSEVDGKGLVVPCVYIFKGKQKHLERLINLFAKLTG